MRLVARMRNPAMTENLLPKGTDGVASVSPFWGRINWAKTASPSRFLGSLNQQRAMLIWAACLAGACAALAGSLLAAGFELPSVWEFVALAAVTAAAERQGVRIARNVETSVAFLPCVFCAVAFGPLAALAVGLLANTLDFRRPYLRWFVYIPVRGITGALTGLAAVWVVPTHKTFAAILGATIVASLASVLSDGVLNVATLFVRRSAPLSVFVRSVGPFAVLSLPLYVPVVALMVYGSEHYSFWTAAMFLGPILALQRVVHLYQRQRDVSEKLVLANSRLETANISFAAALVATLDARDRYTAGHSASVATYARDIAERLGQTAEEQHLAYICGLVHDIGKVGLPAGLLEKPGPLSLEERRQMEKHPAIGETILANVSDYEQIARIVRHHHERVDGQGYPDRLHDEAIPLTSKILAVADAYNAMTSDRPYRDAMPPQVARMRMAQAVGSQFDTTVVAAFEAILAVATEEYRFGVGPEFVLGTPAERVSVEAEILSTPRPLPRLRVQAL